MSGNAKAMQVLAHVYNYNVPAKDFIAKFAVDYREKLYVKEQALAEHMDVEKIIKEHGQLPLPLFLRCKVKYFTKSTNFGSKEFVDTEFEKHHYAFCANRRNGARSIRMCEHWDGICLYSARRLQKKPVCVSA